MRENSNDPKNRVPDRLRQWLKSAQSRGADLYRKSRVSKLGDRIPQKWKDLDFDLRKFQLGDISQFTRYFRWGLIVIALFFLAEFTSRMVGLWLKPGYVPPPPPSMGTAQKRQLPQSEYDAILSRNMFNVEGTIPDPFDQGQLDCFSQAKPSTQRLQLLGTIVMNDEKFSVGLIQEDGAPSKEAVRQGDNFADGKYQALKVDRKRLCFQVRSSQDLEFIEIPEAGNLDGSPSLTNMNPSDGITPISEDKFAVNQSFLEKNILNLNEILQTARAVPYLEPGTGQFKGFLVQSMDADSPFTKLGVRQGDILTSVNDIVLDNAGKGLEAFQRLRNSPKIDLEVIRAGQKKALSFDIRP